MLAGDMEKTGAEIGRAAAAGHLRARGRGALEPAATRPIDDVVVVGSYTTPRPARTG